MKDVQAFLQHRKTMGVEDVTHLLKHEVDDGPLPEKGSTSGSGALAKAAKKAKEVVTNVVSSVMSDEKTKGRIARWAFRKVVRATRRA